MCSSAIDQAQMHQSGAGGGLDVLNRAILTTDRAIPNR